MGPGTVLDDASPFEDEHLVHAVEGAETMSDHHGGPAFEQPVSGRFDESLCLRIEAARSLVEKDEAGIDEKGAGEGDELGLAGGQPAGARDVTVESTDRIEPSTESDVVQDLVEPTVLGRAGHGRG